MPAVSRTQTGSCGHGAVDRCGLLPSVQCAVRAWGQDLVCVGAALFWRKGPFTHGQAERREGPFATKAGVTFSPPEASPQAHVVIRSIPLAYVKLRVCRGRVIGNRGGAA